MALNYGQADRIVGRVYAMLMKKTMFEDTVRCTMEEVKKRLDVNCKVFCASHNIQCNCAKCQIENMDMEELLMTVLKRVVFEGD